MVVDLVVPCFNEESRWSGHYWEQMLQLPEVRWTFVNDGSTDATLAVLKETVAENAASSRVRVLDLPRNAGKAEAVRLAMLDVLSSSEPTDAVGYMDADGAFDVRDVGDLVASFRHHVLVDDHVDAVWSSRVALAGRNIQRHASRHYIGRLIATYVSSGQGPIPYDTQSGLKLFRPSALLVATLSTPFRTRWLFELEILARWPAAAGTSLKVWEEPLNSWHDVPGSKIRGGETLRIVRELTVVKAEQRRWRRNASR